MRRSEVDQDTTHGRVRYLHGVGTGRDRDGRAGLLGRAGERGPVLEVGGPFHGVGAAQLRVPSQALVALKRGQLTTLSHRGIVGLLAMSVQQPRNVPSAAHA